MDNKQVRFDPMTGQPISQNENSTDIIQTNIVEQTVVPVEPVQTNQIDATPNFTNNNISTQQQMQSIPTVEQDKQNFISNTQADSTAKEEVKKDGPNIVFIVIMFLVIFAAIFFLFPYLLKTLG